MTLELNELSGVRKQRRETDRPFILNMLNLSVCMLNMLLKLFFEGWDYALVTCVASSGGKAKI